MLDLQPTYAIKESRLFTGKNFMTPTILGYGRIGDKFVYEVSEGPAIFEVGKKIYGFTVKDIKTFETHQEYSGPFASMGGIDEAIKAIEEKEGIL